MSIRSNATVHLPETTPCLVVGKRAARGTKWVEIGPWECGVTIYFETVEQVDELCDRIRLAAREATA